MRQRGVPDGNVIVSADMLIYSSLLALGDESTRANQISVDIMASRERSADVVLLQRKRANAGSSARYGSPQLHRRKATASSGRAEETGGNEEEGSRGCICLM